MAPWRLATLRSLNPSSDAMRSQSRWYRSAMSSSIPRSAKSRTRCSPNPSMSMAPREAKCSTAPVRWKGHSGSTQRVSASPSGRTRVLCRGQGQAVGNDPRLGALGPVVDHRADHLGDHVAGPTHHHHVAGPHVLDRHLVLVVQGGLRDGDAADEHRVEHGEGRGPARAADGDHDVAQPRGALLGRELVGDGPARRPAGGSQLLAPRQVVDLHDHTVDLVVEVVAVLLPAEAELVHRVERPLTADLRVHREPEVAQEVERLVVGGELRARPRSHPAGSSTATARARR